MKIFLVGAAAASEAHHGNIYLLDQRKSTIAGVRLADRENGAKSIPP